MNKCFGFVGVIREMLILWCVVTDILFEYGSGFLFQQMQAWNLNL